MKIQVHKTIDMNSPDSKVATALHEAADILMRAAETACENKNVWQVATLFRQANSLHTQAWQIEKRQQAE